MPTLRRSIETDFASGTLTLGSALTEVRGVGPYLETRLTDAFRLRLLPTVGDLFRATRNRTTTRSREATRHPASAPEATLEPGLGFCPGFSRPAPPCPGPRGNPGARPWLVRPPPATIVRLTAASHPPAPLLYHRGLRRASASLAATLAPCSRLGDPHHICDLGDLRRAHSRQPTL